MSDLREDAGKLAENFVLNQISNEHCINFWRTTAKAEVDFVLNLGKELVPVEVKFENFRKPKITRSMRSFVTNYRPGRGLVITKDFCGEVRIKDTLIKFVPIVYI
ncbi:MAG: DUF4143 domain-containing protein [Candidatus Micrarchaeota archaeon]|nr:DUF4143 domain-containing protein [Candidatus Micrarchaeota archaeon]